MRWFSHSSADEYAITFSKVCEGDTIIVEVKNNLLNGEATSIHWHGLHLRNEPYMDGVALLTQCPISPLSSFTYTFNGTQSLP